MTTKPKINNTMPVKGAIFDLDGTILDSMFVWDTVGEDYLINRGITPEPGLNDKFKVMSIAQAAEYYQSHYGITDSVATIISSINRMIDHFYADTVISKKGVPAVLQKLQADGVKMCIATATDRYMVESALQRNGLLDYFSEILTCSEVGFGKDNPQIFLTALAKLKTKKNETLVFEDAAHAIATAKAAGFTVVGVFDQSAAQEQQKIQALADYYLSSFENWSELYD